MAGLLHADDAVRVLNKRPGIIQRPVDIGEGRELVHEGTGRVFVDWIVPEFGRGVRQWPRRWYILVTPTGERRNYGENYGRAVRHFEYLTRGEAA